MSGRVARSARTIAAVSGLCLLLLLVVWGVERRGALDAWLATRIAARVGPLVRFDGLHTVWWPRLAVRLDEVALVPSAPAPGGGRASATAVTCRVRLLPLLRGQVHIGAVEVDGLQLDIERDAGGALRAGGLESFAAQAASAPPGAPTAALPVVRVHDGALAYRDAAAAPARSVALSAVRLDLEPAGAGARAELTATVDGGGTLRLRGTLDALADAAAAHYRVTLDADGLDAAALPVWLPPPARQTSAQGRLRLTATLSGHGTAEAAGNGSLELSNGSLAWAEWQVGAPLRVAAQATWNGGALTVSAGHVDAARLAGTAVAADAVAASFAYAGATLRVDAAQARAWGGTWRPAGSLRLGDPLRIDGTLEADGVDGAQLAATLKTMGVAAALPELGAPLHLTAQASGAPGGRWNGTATIATDGAATWPAARLDGPLQISADVQADGAALELSNGRARVQRVALGTVPIDGLDASFAYARGVARVAPLRAAALGGAWSYTGTVPLAATAAWSGQLSGTQLKAAALRDALAAGAADAALDGAIDLTAQLSGTGSNAVSGAASARLASPGLAWDDLRIGAPATVSATLRIQGARATLSNGHAQAQHVQLGALAASTLSGDFTYGDETLHLAALTARAFAGRWHAGGSLALAAAPRWSGTVDARHVDFAALLHALDAARDGPSSIGGVADLQVSATRGSDGDPHGTAALTLRRGEFIWDDLRVEAPAHASGAFSVHGDDVRLRQVAATAARAAYGPLAGTSASARLEYGSERLSFDSLRFTACGGTWTHSGLFTLDEGGQFSGQIGIEGAVPHELATMLDNASFDVPFARLDLDSEFSGNATDHWLSDLHASGTVYLSDGTIPAATVLRPIWEALIGPGRMMNAIDRRTTHVDEVSDSFTLRQGRLHTTDLSMTTNDYSVTAVGSVGLDGSLDLNARIQLTARGVQTMLVFASLPLPTSALPTLPPIPARVTGRFGNPVIRPNVSALPASTVTWMVDVLLHGPRALGGALVDGLGSLWDRIRGVPAEP